MSQTFLSNMAIDPRITDDNTGRPIVYPYLSVRSVRLELSPTNYIWLGKNTLHTFENGISLGEWAEKEMLEILDRIQDPEVDY